MDSIINLATLKDVGPTSLVIFICLMILSDQLVLKRRLTAVEKQRDKWQQIALDLLGVANKMTSVNETAVETIDKRLPTPETVTEVVKQIRSTPDDE